MKNKIKWNLEISKYIVTRLKSMRSSLLNNPKNTINIIIESKNQKNIHNDNLWWLFLEYIFYLEVEYNIFFGSE